MLLLDSVFINNSGGRVLLNYLVQKIEDREINCFYLFDSRCNDDFQYIPAERKHFTIAEKGRKKFYLEQSNMFSKILCFGNVPPPFKLNIPVYTYFHNLLFFRPFLFPGILVKLNCFIKGQYIRYRRNNSNEYWVQTAYGSELLQKYLHLDGSRIRVLPFYEDLNEEVFEAKEHNYEILYVSNGIAHKNHLRLLRAWKTIQKHYPEATLHLTVDEECKKVYRKITNLQLKGYRIYNYGLITKQALRKLYSKCCWLVYPSLIESFGLGLLEGSTFGNRIIASDLPYVHSVIRPTAVFQPGNIQSIANAIIKVLDHGKQTLPAEPLIKNEITTILNLLATSSNKLSTFKRNTSSVI